MSGARIRRGSLLDQALRALDRAGEPLTAREIGEAMGGAEDNAVLRAIRAVPWMIVPAGLRTGTDGDVGQTLYARPAVLAARAGTRPAAPAPRKLRGHAENYDGEAVVYTERELLAHGEAEFAAGFTAGAAGREPPAKGQPDTRSTADRLADEEDAWNEWRRGRAPMPGRDR